jgi:hypothetical protein
MKTFTVGAAAVLALALKLARPGCDDSFPRDRERKREKERRGA